MRLSQISTGSTKCLLGNVEITQTHYTIEMVAVDKNGYPKPDSYAKVECSSTWVAERRVQTAGVLFHSFKDSDRQLAAEEMFRALRGGYDNR